MMFMDPDLDPSQVAMAMVELDIALGEPGSFEDPRRPRDTHSIQAFDRATLAIATVWKRFSHSETVDMTEAAGQADLTVEVLRFMFPTPADAADSVVRSQLVDLGLVPLSGAAEPTMTPALIVGALRKIALVTDRLPGAIACLQANRVKRGTSVLQDALSDLREALQDIGVPFEVATTDSTKLIEAASKGTEQLEGESELLRKIQNLIPKSPRI